MLTAKNKNTGETIKIFDYKKPRIELNKNDLECPFCGGELIIKSGLVVSPHFSHKQKCSCDYERHAESPEHLFFKEYLSKHIGKEFSEYFGIEPIIEYPIKEVKRIADIIFIFPNGWAVAHEVQLSSITTETLEDRTNDYWKAGIDIVWWLGKNANTDTNRKWCIDKFGECLTINYQQVGSVSRI